MEAGAIPGMLARPSGHTLSDTLWCQLSFGIPVPAASSNEATKARWERGLRKLLPVLLLLCVAASCGTEPVQREGSPEAETSEASNPGRTVPAQETTLEEEPAEETAGPAERANATGY